MDTRTNQQLYPSTAKRIGFYNGDGVCLLRGMNHIFKNSVPFIVSTDKATLSQRKPASAGTPRHSNPAQENNRNTI
jgi:hypothetical protein